MPVTDGKAVAIDIPGWAPSATLRMAYLMHLSHRNLDRLSPRIVPIGK
jgi:hypothetical protein